MIRRCLMVLCLFWLTGVTAALADKRVALVIGNGAYKTLGALRNPAADAGAIARMLEGGTLGFRVISAVDADHAGMLKALSDFGNAAQDADIALVFYAGHGIQADERNYLIPVSADIRSRVDLPTQAIRLNDISEVMDASGAKAKILLIDACRNNPLPASATRDSARGLARLDTSTVGTLIAFATGPGSVADDGNGDHSPFATALLARLAQPDLEIRQALARVREDVHSVTGQRQTPWVNEALLGDLYLAGRSSTPASAPASPPSGTGATPADNAACTALGASPTTIQLEAYLDNFPQGYCSASVKRRLAAAKPGSDHVTPGEAQKQGPATKTQDQVGYDVPLEPEEQAAQDVELEPETPRAGGNAPNYAIASYWDHNGSRVALSASKGNRVFYYEAPRAGLLSQGVRKGALLFKGTASGSVYRGQAYVFSRECGPISYRVEGSAAGQLPTITLRGKAPRRAKDCAQTGWRDDTLVFRYDSAAR